MPGLVSRWRPSWKDVQAVVVFNLWPKLFVIWLLLLSRVDKLSVESGNVAVVWAAEEGATHSFLHAF